MKAALIVVGILVGALALFTLIGGYVMYRFAIVRDKSGRKQINYWDDGADLSIPFARVSDGVRERCTECAARLRDRADERVYITSRDGIKLCGHVLNNDAGRGVAILMHGYRSCGLIDFALSAERFYDMGFTVLMPDQRANGESEGRHISFGVLERYDAVDWAKYAADRWEQSIVMCGVSLGASTVMMGCSVGYPASVRAIIADCGYSSPEAICAKCMKAWFKLPKFPVYYGAVAWIKLLAGFDMNAVNCRDSLAKLRGTGVKILVAHGLADNFVPCEMSCENTKAFDYMPESARREVMELLLTPGAGHGMSFGVNEREYLAAIDRLFAKAGI